MRYDMEALDIEAALQAALASDGYSASARPLPASLGSVLPHVHVERTGGFEHGPVQDMHQVDLDVYAADDAEAMACASELCGWVRSLPGGTLGGAPVYAASVPTLPYANHDPRHERLARATLKASILTRTA